VGANIGFYTVLLADKVGKNGKVYAFEPDKTNFEILVKNIKENNLENVVVVNAAVGRKSETKILYKSEENLGDHKLYKTPLGSAASPLDEGETVKIIKLDDYIKEPINLMKIDTQGWEPEVIEGAKELIKKNKPVIFLEYSPASYKQAKLNGKKMMDFLRKIYKKIWWIDEWLYVYRNLSQERIDEICRTNKTGYADLWMKKEVDFGDKIGQIKNLRVKQLIKNILKNE
jgi:FkbM family methyltransferase